MTTAGGRGDRPNVIHPSATITDDVELGSGNIIGPNTIIHGPARIGDDNWIVAASIGLPPDHRGWWMDQHPLLGVVIGDRNVVREYATIHAGIERVTEVGNDCFVMSKAYLAHDVVVGDAATISAGVLVGGHCSIGAGANLGMGAAVHQRLAVGAGCMIGMNATVTREVPAFAKAFGSPARVHGVNRHYLEQLGWSEDQIAQAARELGP